MKPVNSLIAEGKVFAWFLDSEIPDADIIRNKLDKLGIECLDINLLSKADYAAVQLYPRKVSIYPSLTFICALKTCISG